MFLDTNEVQENQDEMFMDSNYTISESQEIKEEINELRLGIEKSKKALDILKQHKELLLTKYKWTKQVNAKHVERVTHHKAIIANHWSMINELYSMLNQISVANQEGIPA